jgi:predicted TIM-barrel fold metal-dependent hydrolase
MKIDAHQHFWRWYEMICHWTERWSEDEEAKIFGGTAIQVYRLAI